MDRPSSETVPGLPRMGQLDDVNLKKALPGSFAVSYSDVTHYVPLEDSIRERAGEFQFRVVSAPRAEDGSWTNSAFFSRATAEESFKAIILGVASEGDHLRGANANLVRDLVGGPANVTFAGKLGDGYGKVLVSSPTRRL